MHHARVGAGGRVISCGHEPQPRKAAKHHNPSHAMLCYAISQTGPASAAPCLSSPAAHDGRHRLGSPSSSRHARAEHAPPFYQIPVGVPLHPASSRPPSPATTGRPTSDLFLFLTLSLAQHLLQLESKRPCALLPRRHQQRTPAALDKRHMLLTCRRNHPGPSSAPAPPTCLCDAKFLPSLCSCAPTT